MSFRIADEQFATLVSSPNWGSQAKVQVRGRKTVPRYGGELLAEEKWQEEMNRWPVQTSKP
jgi:hypothetical protein